MTVHDTVGDILDQLISGFTNAILYIFKQLAGAIGGPIASQIGGPLLETLLYTPLPQHCPSGGSVSTCSNPQPALATQPTNGPWPDIWEFYWDRFFVVAIVVGLFLYVLTHFVGSIPWINPRYRERLRGGYLKLIVALPLGWPILTVVLFLMNALNHLIAPSQERFDFLVQNVIGGIVVASASPLAILTSLVGLVSVALVALTLAVFVLRIIFLIFVFAIAPVLIMCYTLEVPIGKQISQSVFRLWVKLGIAPMLVGGAFTIATLLMTEPNGSGGYTYGGLNTFGGLGAFVNMGLGFMIPIIGIFGMVFVTQASMPAAGTTAMHTAKRGLPSAAVANLGGERTNVAKQRFEQGRSQVIDKPAKVAVEKPKSAAVVAGPSWLDGGQSGADSTQGSGYETDGGWDTSAVKNEQLAEALDGGDTSDSDTTGGDETVPVTTSDPASSDTVGTVLTDNMKETPGTSDSTSDPEDSEYVTGSVAGSQESTVESGGEDSH
jgi:hypothetical protein